MKKMISLVLCTLMAASLCLTAFAVDAPGSEGGIQPLARCPDGCREANMSSWTYQSTTRMIIGSQCGNGNIYRRVCRACGSLETRTEPDITTFVAHHYAGITSSCSGTTQTLRFRCSYGCGSGKTETQPCPMAGHPSSTCNWLPF